MARKPRSLRSLALVCLVATIVAGCSNTQPTTTGSQTQAGEQPTASAQRKLIAEADPICASASAKREEANAKLGHASSLTSPAVLKSISATAPGVAAYEEQAVSKLRRLNAPTSIAQDWRSMLAGLQQLAHATARLGAYAREGNAAAAEKLVSGTENTRKELLAIAERDSFKSCGRAD